MEDAIPTRLEQIIIQEAPSNSKGKKLFSKVAERLYTPKGGTFLVKLKPTKSSPDEEIVTLLFRWKDLYFEAFHAKGKWYRMSDAEESLPPRSQLHYSKKEKEGVFNMNNISTSYNDVGGHNIEVGRRAFKNCHQSLLMAEELVRQKRLKEELGSGPLSLPVVTISESIRFPLLQRWVLGTFSAPPTAKSEKKVPKKFSCEFNEWGKYSRALFTQELPVGCELTFAQIAEKLRVLKYRAAWVPQPAQKHVKDV
ncbi:hypothetical protein DAI22_08g227800 [Oryza sativa Japonica Group]|nr:hypothetical protein DAI22_08g227800 [Oryza sativa Japonica Group]